MRTAATIEVRAEAGVATLFSPTHALDVVRRSDTHVVASFEEKASRTDRDLRVLWGLGKNDVGFQLASGKPPGEDGTFLMLLSPNREAEGETLSKDVVFVLDTSGSMGERGGEKFRQAKAALSYALGRFSAKDRFNVVAFATAPHPFRDGVVEASAENVRAGLVFVDSLEATGGTAIHDALLAALRLERADRRVPIVLFLTDGEATVGPTETPAILSAVESANAAQARIFCFGVGDDLNASLLTELAERTRGNAIFVSERENVEMKGLALDEQVASPVFTDVALHVDGVHDVHPRRLGDLFTGQQVAVVGRYATPGKRAVRLTGKLGGREVSFTYDAHFSEAAGRDYLPRLWAIRQVGFLLSEIRARGEKPELAEEVRRLGTRYGIVTPYTSFLVVKEERRIRIRWEDVPHLRRDVELAREALEEAEAEMALAKWALAVGSPAGPAAVAGARIALRLGAAGTDAQAGVGVRAVATRPSAWSTACGRTRRWRCRSTDRSSASAT